MLVAKQMIQHLQVEQLSLKAALAEQTAAQQKIHEDMRQHYARRDTEVQQFITNIKTELSETRVALKNAQAALEAQDMQRKVRGLHSRHKMTYHVRIGRPRSRTGGQQCHVDAKNERQG
jgi:excinuclease UvrABC helicase subunit UvrB